MAAFEEHCRDCERIIGNRCEQVNHWLDEKFCQFGPLHRFARHHWRGVDEAGKQWGELGRKAAIIHILKDCGWVPSARDWEEKRVDSLGFKVTRPYGLEPTAELVCGTFNGYWDPKEFVVKAKELIDAD
jgi:hypothetical protein